ncbi:MAG: WG repeat-containing protein [Paludibacteraceae bacterium]|nr:WG repeat-containing protein [Paludibacteraceae bacterium]
MKKRIAILFALFFLCYHATNAQSAYGQLKQMGGNVSVPKASNPACAYCGAKGGAPHKSTCPYAPKAGSSSAGGTSAGAKTSNPSVSANSYMISTATSLLGNVLSSALSYNSHRQITAQPSTKPGNGDNGFYVMKGSDGYISIWDDNSQRWVIDPQSSTFPDIIIYDSRAACLLRWAGKKWGIMDLERNGSWLKKFVQFFTYDDVICIAKDAPIGVGLKKKKQMIWGLFTKNKTLGTWSLTQTPQYTSISMLYADNRYFALCGKDGLYTLIDLYGKVIIPLLYKNISPAYVSEGILYFTIEGEDGWGLVNEFGDTILPCIYQSIFLGENGIEVIEKQQQ